MPSLKNNLLYSIILVLANYVFPFLVYPYVSRVLGVTGMGECNFVDSVINYFIIFSTLGINTLGVREIAKNKNDSKSLNRTFSNLLLVNLSLTGIMLVLLVVVTFAVPQLNEHKDLMFIGGFKLVFNCLLVEWLFRGLEDFKYITLRSVIIKLVYVAAVFLFVRDREDVSLYYLISTLTIVLNAIVNIAFSQTRVRLTLKGLALFATFKSMLALGIYSILISMYTTFNVTFLGFVSGEEQVGYYYSATRIYQLILSVFTAFTSVMIPRISSLVSSGEIEKVKSYFTLAVEVVFAFSFPIIVWMMIMAPDIVRVISGAEYGGAVIPMTIIAPLLFIVAYEQVLIMQTLMPLGKDRVLLRNSAIGALTGVLLNVLLVPGLGSVGSSLVWIATECLILVLSQIAVTNAVSIRFPLWPTLKNAIVYLPLIVIVFACHYVPGGAFIRMGASMLVVGAYIIIYQFWFKKGRLIKALK